VLPADADRDDAELAGLVAGDELAWGSLEEAERFLGLAARGSASVPADRCAQWQVLLGVVRLLLALYRFRTRRRYCDLRFGRTSWLRQDRGLCPFACST
jgi:hypothetical protein